MKDWPRIETERLLLRPFSLTDAGEVQRLAGEWRVARTTLTIPHPYPDGMGEEWIRRITAAWQERKQATCAITDRHSGELYGAISLSERDTDQPELGYWIGLPWWNRGYCTEAARAFIGFCIDELGHDVIRAEYLVNNPASGRVMQKLGMQWRGTGTRTDRHQRDATVGIYEIRRA